MSLLPAGVTVLVIAGSIMGAGKTDWETLQARKNELSGMRPPSAEGEEFDRFVKEFSTRAGQLADSFKHYYDRNTDSKEGREAWRQWMDHLDLAAKRIPERKVELEETEKRLLADPDLNRAFREKIRWNQVDRIYDLGERERFVRSVKDEFSGASFVSYHLLNIAELTDPEHARALVEEVLQLPRPEDEQAYWEGKAMELKAKLDRIGKSLALRFTALDGAKVDLKDYAGKVVLIDFWATWCGPCVAAIPKLRKISEMHQGKGFEIICISYDTDRKTLDDFIKKNAISWPQFFSDEGRDAPLVTEFGKPGPPAYWLVDRNGTLADFSSWKDLEGKVERLLAKNENRTITN